MDNMENFIEVNNLSVSFDVRAGLLLRKIGTIQAVNNVSFSIKKGEILGGVRVWEIYAGSLDPASD